MKILLTGSSGFIGRNLFEHLEQKYDMKAPDSDRLNLLDTEKTEHYLKKHNFDIIIHAANTNNIKHPDVTAYDILDRNLRMFLNLQRCSGRYGRMYYFGSGAEYDMRHYIPAMSEEYFGMHVPKDPYGFSKYVMSQICQKSTNIYELCLFGVYGKYEEWERRFISNAICRVLAGRDITIHKNVYFDYLWIDDLCGIMQWFIENEPKRKRYNVCRGSRIDLYSLAKIVRRLLGSSCDILIEEPGWKAEYSGNNTRLLQELGGYSFTSFDRAISELCGYYKSTGIWMGD